LQAAMAEACQMLHSGLHSAQAVEGVAAFDEL
jgi:hypothetical protein